MFEKVFVKSPKRARFDFSHGNTLSMQFGKLTPTEVRFICPGDDVSVSMEQIIRCAPMPVPTFVNMKVRHDWFFVPLSMLYDQNSLNKLFGQSPSSYQRAHFSSLYSYVKEITEIPLNYGNDGVREPFVPGSIHDFFNLPVLSDNNVADSAVVNPIPSEWTAFVANPNSTTYSALVELSAVKTALSALPGPIIEPHLAYHYIWRDWYRFTGMEGVTSHGWLENHVFNSAFLQSPVAVSDDLDTFNVSQESYHGANSKFYTYIGVPYYAYLKKDEFTSARYGTKPQVLIPTGAQGTIPNLRTASALQKFIDIVSVAGQRYWDKVKALFDETPEGMKNERAVFLARYMSYIKVGEVITTASTSQANTGDYAGRGMLVDGKYLFKRHFTEHGWLFCISSIVPEMAYCGYDRQMTDTNILDTPVPTFANIGDQSIINREIRVMYTSWNANNGSFGDQFRYYAYKADVNRVHGDFLMQSFAPWTATMPYDYNPSMNALQFGVVSPFMWTKVFDQMQSKVQPLFNGRFFVDLTFHEFITRKLPKYISYAL